MKRKRFPKGTYHGRPKMRSLRSRAALRAELIWQEAKRVFETGDELIRPVSTKKLT